MGVENEKNKMAEINLTETILGQTFFSDEAISCFTSCETWFGRLWEVDSIGQRDTTHYCCICNKSAVRYMLPLHRVLVSSFRKYVYSVVQVCCIYDKHVLRATQY